MIFVVHDERGIGLPKGALRAWCKREGPAVFRFVHQGGPGQDHGAKAIVADLAHQQIGRIPVRRIGQTRSFKPELLKFCEVQHACVREAFVDRVVAKFDREGGVLRSGGEEIVGHQEEVEGLASFTFWDGCCEHFRAVELYRKLGRAFVGSEVPRHFDGRRIDPCGMEGPVDANALFDGDVDLDWSGHVPAFVAHVEANAVQAFNEFRGGDGVVEGGLDARCGSLHVDFIAGWPENGQGRNGALFRAHVPRGREHQRFTQDVGCWSGEVQVAGRCSVHQLNRRIGACDQAVVV